MFVVDPGMAYDDVALGRRELELIGKLWCPCRVGILSVVSTRVAVYAGDVRLYHMRGQLRSRPRRRRCASSGAAEGSRR